MFINLTKKVPVVLAALVVSGSVFAGPDMETRLQQLEQQMKQVRTETAMGTYGAKTAPARPEVDGNGVFATVDVLYWHAKVGGTEYAYSDADVTGIAPPVQGRLKEVDFDWDWGFRFGLGYNFDHDSWDTYLNYTYFNSADGSRLNVGANGSVIPLRGASSQVTGLTDPCATSASSNYDFEFNNLDLELGRNYFVSHSLSFRPFIGVRSSWLELDQGVQYTGGTFTANTYHVKDSNDFWGLGPRAGLNSNWFLGNGFSIFGDLSGSLLFGYFQVNHKEWYSLAPLTNKLRINGNMHRFTPNAQMSLGLAYDKYVNNNKQHVGVTLGYEVNYYWRVNQMIVDNDQAQLQFNRESEDASMYGLTLEVRFDF